MFSLLPLQLVLFLTVFVLPFTISQDFYFEGIFIVPNVHNRYRVNILDLEALHVAGFLPNFPTVMVIHGYGVDGLQEWNITAGLIENGVAANFFTVFWNGVAKQALYPNPSAPLDVTVGAVVNLPIDYFTATFDVPKIAQAVAEFFTWLHDIQYIRGENIHLIGHSLGAQMSGEIARIYRSFTRGDTIRRISALDPAGPGYTVIPLNSVLSGDDADFVDVYHSNSGLMGTIPGKLKGRYVEFVINGGVKQPGCYGLKLGIQQNLVGWALCSHIYSQYIFRSSIKEIIYGCRCPIPDKGFGLLPECLKTCEVSVQMGFHLDESSESGKYYVRSNRSYGFLRGYAIPRESIDGKSAFITPRPT